MIRNKTRFHAMHKRVFICGSFDMRKVTIFAKMPSYHVGYSLRFQCVLSCVFICWSGAFCSALKAKSRTDARNSYLPVIFQKVIGSIYSFRLVSKHVFCTAYITLRERFLDQMCEHTTETKNRSQRIPGVSLNRVKFRHNLFKFSLDEKVTRFFVCVFCGKVFLFTLVVFRQ